MIITDEKAKELVAYGQAINVLVTPEFIDGVPNVNMRDQQFDDVVRAFLYLKHIEMNELPESLLHLVA
jgi:hypothetical protein